MRQLHYSYRDGVALGVLLCCMAAVLLLNRLPAVL